MSDTPRSDLLTYEMWEAIAKRITTKDRSYHYDSSDDSHMIDVAQIVCEAIVAIRTERQCGNCGGVA